jgi:hypothetical protein
MWDAPQITQLHLSHDLACSLCGHAAHSYLACSDACACVPPTAPGAIQLAA